MEKQRSLSALMHVVTVSYTKEKSSRSSVSHSTELDELVDEEKNKRIFQSAPFVQSRILVLDHTVQSRREKRRIFAPYIKMRIGFHRTFFEQKTHTPKENMSPVATSAVASASSAKVHSAQAENVHVQSVVQTETQSKVSMENTKKINDLMARLGSTHLQVDEYSRKRTEEISEAVAESIKRVVNETQEQQQQLLADANRRTSGNENARDERFFSFVQLRL